MGLESSVQGTGGVPATGLFPTALPGAGAVRFLSLYQRAVPAAGVEERMPADMTHSQPSDPLPSRAFGPFCPHHFLTDHPDSVFQLEHVPPLISAVPLAEGTGRPPPPPQPCRGDSDAAPGSLQCDTPLSCRPGSPDQLCRPNPKFLQRRVHMVLVRCESCQHDPLS